MAEKKVTEAKAPAKAAPAKAPAAKAAPAKAAPAKAAPAKAAPAKAPAAKAAPAAETKAAAAAKATATKGKYIIESVYGDLYQFSLYANNGQLLYESREYASKKSCAKGIETFKKNIADEQYTTIRVDKDKNGRFKYIIKNRNSIYVGETYSKEAQAESSAESVKRFALVSPLVDKK